MHLTTASSLILAALAASIVLLFQHKERVFPAFGVIASGLEALMAFHLLTMRSGSLPISLILAGVLVAASVVVWFRSAGKTAVTAATLASVVGVLQVLNALDILK